MSRNSLIKPPTKGKVLLVTSSGNILIDLFANEAPFACRNFMQLCLEKYYNNTFFNRIVKDFLIQGGTHIENGQGGICIYERCSYFKDKFHDNIKFTNKGMVACANRNLPNTNNSQFFITLERADYLNKKNTIFGEIERDSMFNVIKINGLEVDTYDRPFDTPKIITIKVIWNPFKDSFLYVLGEKNRISGIIE